MYELAIHMLVLYHNNIYSVNTYLRHLFVILESFVEKFFIYDYICQVFYSIIKLGFRAIETDRAVADLYNFILPKWH